MGISNFLKSDLYVDKKFKNKKEALEHFCSVLEKKDMLRVEKRH